ncbi:MAG: hypothetical protein EOP84_18520 [Verrucomicrobiaceae bacterium]|nr:MAG: hypothetical protein EOP84_18520 [Verrucomicrobiaceae bacterium]
MTEIIHATDTSTPHGLVFQAQMESLGWLILTHSQIDAAFSEFIGHFMVGRSELGMMETVFNGMPINAKVEILKAFCRSNHGQPDGDFKGFGLALCEDIERVSFKRNIAAHGVPWKNPKGREGLKLDSTAKWLHKNKERYVLFYDDLLAEVSTARALLQLLEKLNAAWKRGIEKDEIEAERPMMEFVQDAKAIFEGRRG